MARGGRRMRLQTVSVMERSMGEGCGRLCRWGLVAPVVVLQD